MKWYENQLCAGQHKGVGIPNPLPRLSSWKLCYWLMIIKVFVGKWLQCNNQMIWFLVKDRGISTALELRF